MKNCNNLFDNKNICWLQPLDSAQLNLVFLAFFFIVRVWRLHCPQCDVTAEHLDGDLGLLG